MNQENKKQILFIHGGTVLNTEELHEYLKNSDHDPRKERGRWINWVRDYLPEEYEMFIPEMPNKRSADYESWKIWFEKFFPYLNDEVVLIGYSLGGCFLAKYLSENDFPKKIDQLHFVCPVIISEGPRGEDIKTFSFDTQNLSEIKNKTEKIFIYHSKDDPVVSFYHSEFLVEKLPSAEFFQFEDKGHFFQEEFPEILENILKNKKSQ
jgi:predicted alpha/beta hydrolase family esterase